MTTFLTANSYLGFAVEATRGTVNPAATPYYVPVTSPQVSPMQKFLQDNALRGSAAMTYDQVQGVRHDEFDHKSYLYADTFPVYLRAILGGTDTVTGATYYTHTIKLLNSPSTGSQPPSYSILDFDGANYFTIAGAQASDLTLTYGAETAGDAALKWIGNPYADSTSAAAPFTALSISSEHPIPTWDTTISVGGTQLTYIQTGELKIDRKTAPIFTMGTQAPYQNFAGPVEVTGKFTALVASNADPFSTPTATGYALTRSPEAVVITLTSPNDITSATNHSIQFTMSAVQFENVKRTRTKDYVELEVEFTANANSTDAATGFSPLQAVVINGQSAAY